MSAGSRTVFLLNALIVTCLTVAILFFVNLLSIDHFKRMDLTQKSIYTLDDLSKEISGRFADAVTVRYYVTEDKFPPGPRFDSMRQLVVDKLQEYTAASKNKMVLKVIDPREGKKEISKEIKEKLEAEGVVLSSHRIYRDDQPVAVEFYSSIKINYLDKTRWVNDVMDVANLEYRFTRALKELQVFDIPQVGFYFSGSEKGFAREGHYKNIQDVLRKDYTVTDVKLGEDDPVPGDINVLFVVAPENVPERHKYEIDQFIMRGGKVVFLLDVFDPSKSQKQWMRGPALFMKIDSKLDDMLSHYGITPQPNILLDVDECPFREVPRRIMVEGIPIIKREKLKMPYIILTRQENYNPDLGFVSQLDRVGFIFAHSLKPTPAVKEDGGPVRFQPIIRSSQKSWRIKFAGPVMIESTIENQTREPEKNRLEQNPEGHQYVIAALLEGRFKSFFAGKDVPDPADAPDEAPNPQKPWEKKEKKKKTPGKKPKTVEDSPETRIVVIGDSGLFSDLALPYPPNVVFLENLLEWLSTVETLSKIRAKSVDSRPLKNITPLKKTTWTLVLVCVPPAVVLLLGLAVFAIRKFEKSVFLRAISADSAQAPLPQTPADKPAGPAPQEPPSGEEPPDKPKTDSSKELP